MSRTHIPTESGNAVTLTLLGLAVAVLAGVAVLYVVGKQRPVPVPVTQPVVQETEPEPPANPREGWHTYESAEYAFALEHPQDWMLATGTVLGVPVVTAYAVGQSIDASSTLGVHDLAVRVSIYPEGLPMGGMGDEEASSSVAIAVGEATTRDYLLATTKRPWGTVVRFADAPDSWSDAGYVFARVNIQDERLTYVRGDQESITEAEFDLYAGDRVVREGFVDPQVRAVEEEILRSFRFTDERHAAGVVDRIRVLTPKAGDRVESPLSIEGEARGTWYFEGSFPIVLVTDSGDELASVPAVADGEWMTEEFVPFSVSLTFASTTATSGTLRFVRSNPSGLAEQDAVLSVPVLF